MRRPRYSRAVLKAAPYILLALLLLALVFAFVPSKGQRSETGATLQDVQLTLYPAQDPGAYWQFGAAEVRHDPLSGQTRLSRVRDGGRWIAQGGRMMQDASLVADDLTIDAEDNITTEAATIRLIQHCADIRLKGTPQQAVKVEQATGFSAPSAEVDSPQLSGTIVRPKISFDFEILDSDESSTFGFDLDSTETCRGGVRVPV